MEKFKALDYFRKNKQDYSKKSILGGILSIFTIIITAILIFGYLLVIYYEKPELQRNVFIKNFSDPFLNQLTINIDIIISNSPCDLLDIQRQDSVSDSIMSIRSGIKFERLTYEKSDLIWEKYIDPEIKQQFKEISFQNQRILTGLKLREKCRIFGYFTVSKSPGSIIIQNNLQNFISQNANFSIFSIKSDLSFVINEFSFAPMEVQQIIKNSFIQKTDTNFNSLGNFNTAENNTKSCSFYLKLIEHEYPIIYLQEYIFGQVYKYSYHHECSVFSGANL